MSVLEKSTPWWTHTWLRTIQSIATVVSDQFNQLLSILIFVAIFGRRVHTIARENSKGLLGTTPSIGYQSGVDTHQYSHRRGYVY